MQIGDPYLKTESLTNPLTVNLRAATNLLRQAGVVICGLVESEPEDSKSQEISTKPCGSSTKSTTVTTSQKPSSCYSSDTALPLPLAKILASVAKITPPSILYDPFSGQGSVPEGAAKGVTGGNGSKSKGTTSTSRFFDGNFVGGEIQDIVLAESNGKVDNSTAALAANRSESHVSTAVSAHASTARLRANLFHPPLRPGTVGAIITDPPFDRRETIFGRNKLQGLHGGD